MMLLLDFYNVSFVLAKGEHLMEISYLNAYQFENRYREWMPDLPSHRSQDLNPYAWVPTPPFP